MGLLCCYCADIYYIKIDALLTDSLLRVEQLELLDCMYLQRTRCIYHNVLWWSHCSHIYLFKNCSSLSLSLSLSLMFYFLFYLSFVLHHPVREHSVHMRMAKGYNIKALSTFCFWAGRELYHVTSVVSRTLSVSAVSSEGTLTLKQQARSNENLFYAEFFTFG